MTSIILSCTGLLFIVCVLLLTGIIVQQRRSSHGRRRTATGRRGRGRVVNTSSDESAPLMPERNKDGEIDIWENNSRSCDHFLFNLDSYTCVYTCNIPSFIKFIINLLLLLFVFILGLPCCVYTCAVDRLWWLVTFCALDERSIITAEMQIIIKNCV